MLVKLFRVVMGVLFRGVMSKNVEGLLNIPKKGGVIIASNHQSYYDGPVIASYVWKVRNEKVHYFANRDALERHWGKFITTNIFEKLLGVLIVETEGKGRGDKALKKATEILKKGGIIAIFPEGIISDSGKLRKCHTGVARLALRSGVPVIPVGILNMDKFADRHWIPRFIYERGEFYFGSSMVFEKQKINYKLIKFITRKIMLKISELTGKKYGY